MNDATIPPGFSEPGASRSPFTIEQAVAWGEMDALGHVNNAVYLRWFETVRFHYFERIGLNAHHAVEKVGPILARATIEFRAPVVFPDRLLVSTSVVRLGNSSFDMYNRAFSLGQQRLVAEGEAVIVIVDYRVQKSTSIPPVIRAAIEALEATRAAE